MDEEVRIHVLGLLPRKQILIRAATKDDLGRGWNSQATFRADASGSVDAITGDGITLAFQQAEALAGALAVDDLSLYESEHRRIAFRPAYMGELLNINAFDQPGVELAKVYTHALMGRAGYETQRAELEAMQKKAGDGKYVV